MSCDRSGFHADALKRPVADLLPMWMHYSGLSQTFCQQSVAFTGQVGYLTTDFINFDVPTFAAITKSRLALNHRLP